jgi:hypothetical protein
MIPNAITQAKGRITSPAKMRRESVAARTVAWVRIDRGSVSLIERLRVS